MKNWHALALCMCFMGAPGCGGGVDEKVEQLNVITPESRLKAMLEGPAKDGQSLGSGGQEVMDLIDKIKEKDPAKGEELAKAAQGLSQQDPSKVKSAAKAVLSKL